MALDPTPNRFRRLGATRWQARALGWRGPVGATRGYPGITGAVRAELKLAGLMPGVGPLRPWSFDLDAYRHLLFDDLERELDYRVEAECQARMRRTLSVPGLVIPRIYPDLCCEDLLVQSFETGMSLADFSKRGGEDRAAASEILVRTLFQSLFALGEIHADPHMGNMFFRVAAAGGVEVVLLDWGCTLALERSRRISLLQLIPATQNREEIDLLRSFVALGGAAGKTPRRASLVVSCCRAC